MVIEENKTIAERIRWQFADLFQEEPLVVMSPGRINLIGEHTDYNRGYVLPAAIDKVTVVAMREREDQLVHVVASDLNAELIISLEQPLKPAGNWSDYILGVVEQFQKRKLPVRGFNMVFGGNVPLGAGMSSSAAMECAVAFALNEQLDAKLSRMDLVELAQQAENEFVGVNCGIMDQFSSMFGQKNRVLKLDCETLEYESVPFDLDGFRIVLLDTHVKHSLGSSEYNIRRSQCEAGLALLNRQYPDLTNLRNANPDQLEQVLRKEHPVLYQRCRYVMEENQRLLDACKALHANDLRTFGKLMYASHEGLSRRYEVSCPELDFLVEQVKPVEAVYGARMMGGGFGGCTINLVKSEAVNELIETVGNLYQDHTGTSLGAYVVQIGNGTTGL